MDKLMQLGYDMSRLWAKYWPDYMTGIRNTLIVAVIATLVGCIIYELINKVSPKNLPASSAAS